MERGETPRRKEEIHMTNELRTERENILNRINYLEDWEFDIKMATHLTERMWDRLAEIGREMATLKARLARIDYMLA